MKKRIYSIAIASLLLFVNGSLQAQIGVHTDSPDASAALDINSFSSSNPMGLLLPRMTTAEKNAIDKPAHSLLVFDTDESSVSQNIGTEAIPMWTKLTQYNKHFLYMPSINIPTTSTSGVLLTGSQTLDLYDEYFNDFTQPKIKSASAPATIPYFRKEQLNYYVTYADPSIEVKSISDEGKLDYEVKKYPNYDSFVNIVFVMK